ncbi:hypothetical protein MMC28_008062 [Mycoblastus sanguinarius]|nr:hypothetical protein [Mycoblastus sanguinarius]
MRAENRITTIPQAAETKESPQSERKPYLLRKEEIPTETKNKVEKDILSIIATGLDGDDASNDQEMTQRFMGRKLGLIGGYLKLLEQASADVEKFSGDEY